MTTTDPGVLIASALIDKRQESTEGPLELLFLPSDRSREERSLESAMAAVQIAMDQASCSFSPEAVDPRRVDPSPYGPVAVVSLCGTDEQNTTWLGAVAESLTADGWTGGLLPAPLPPLSHMDGAGPDGTAKPAAFLAFRTIEAPPKSIAGRWPRPPTWDVDADTTTGLCRYLVDWGTAAGATVTLGMGGYRVGATEPDVSLDLVWAATHGYRAEVTYHQRDPLVVRTAGLAYTGQVTCQLIDGSQDWRSRVEEMRGPLLRFADRLDLAFVRTGSHWVSSWINLNAVIPPLPHIGEADVRRNRRLLNRYVPDAHGIQVLTDAHLSRLGPLPDWDVQAQPAGGHLVQARDLEPWFAGPEPDPEVVAAARTDFAGVLLSPEVIAAHG